MKNINEIENILKTAPRARLDPEFKTLLNEQIRSYQSKKSYTKSSFPLWRYIMLAVCILSVSALLGYNYLTTKLTPIDLLSPAKVSASEIIQRSREVFLKSGVIYHQKTKQYIEGKLIATYDLWEDMDTPMLRNHVIYHDTGREIWQWFDLDIRWDADSQKKVIRKDIYVYDELNPKGQKLGSMVDLAARFDDLLNEGVLEAKEGKMDDKDVYVVYDTRENEEKYWDILTFDKNTFRLLKTEKYAGEGEERHASQIVEYEIIENRQRSEENIKKLFLTAPVNISDYKILSRYYYLNGGQNEEYLSEKELIPLESEKLHGKPEMLEETELMLLDTPSPY